MFSSNMWILISLWCHHFQESFTLINKITSGFRRHLQDHHCSREGGSFVCRYGYNGVCSSLPLEGVSDKDYIAHATKHAMMQQRQYQQGKSNGQMLDGIVAWTVYSSSQNLPAVLNDPNRGKQSNFLTKTWGDAFVEKVEIPKSPYLPEVTNQQFESYMKKIARVSKHWLFSVGNCTIQAKSGLREITSCWYRDILMFIKIPSVRKHWQHGTVTATQITPTQIHELQYFALK